MPGTVEVDVPTSSCIPPVYPLIESQIFKYIELPAQIAVTINPKGLYLPLNTCLAAVITPAQAALWIKEAGEGFFIPVAYSVITLTGA